MSVVLLELGSGHIGLDDVLESPILHGPLHVEVHHVIELETELLRIVYLR